MVYPREILINKNVQVFYGNFRLEANIYILFIIKHGKFWLGSKLLLVRMKITKLDFLTLSPVSYNLFLTLIAALIPLVIQGLNRCFALRLDNLSWGRVC